MIKIKNYWDFQVLGHKQFVWMSNVTKVAFKWFYVG